MKMVWKDDVYTAPDTKILFGIVDNKTSEEVYSGVLEKIGNNDITFYLNRFAERYMSPGSIDFTTGVTQHPTMWCDLSILSYRFQTQVLKTEKYVNGYSGDFKNILSEPVNGKLDPRMYFFWTYAGENNISVQIQGV